MQHTDQLLTTDTAILDEVPLERLESEIASFASRIAAATARWLIWIAAYDRREGWATWQTKSMAHWLNWQCGMSPRTAREHVQVARKLEQFPLLRSTFLAGEISYSKARAIARVVNEHNEQELLDLARDATASQLDRVTGKMPDTDTKGEELPKKLGVSVTNNGDGTGTMMITAPLSDIANTKKAIRAKASDVISRQQSDGETKTEVIDRLGGVQAIHADTATAILRGELDAKWGTEHAVLVVADIDALTGIDPNAESTVDNQRVDPAVVQRLCCDGLVQTALVDGNRNEQATGSPQRIVPRRLRRLLERRDHGMCQHPGCEATHRLHAHHVIHWEHGGPTQLENLILLCHFHHHVVHEGGWHIIGAPGGWQFIDANGNQHAVPVLRLPTKAPHPESLATFGAPAPNSVSERSERPAPLAGTGERVSTDYIADVLITNTELRKQRLGLT